MAHSTADHRINKSASVSAGIGGSVQVQVSGGDDVARAEAGGDPREHPARVVPLEERPLEAVRVEWAVAVEPRGGQGVAELLRAHRRRRRGAEWLCVGKWRGGDASLPGATGLAGGGVRWKE